MGANATTFVPAYVAGEILTAANLSVTNSGIPVFADSTARDNSFGGTGEKTLAEGQYAYLEDTNATQVYDGATWQPVGVAPGLVLIKTQTIGTAVASVTVSDAFSSAYDNYRITINGGVASTSNNITMRFGTTATGYYGTGAATLNTNSTAGAYGYNNASEILGAVGDTNNINGLIEVDSPNLAKRTVFRLICSSSEVGGFVVVNNGMENSNTQHTAFTITPSPGTITGGTIRVYGYANS